MARARDLIRFVADVVALARERGAWWMVPLVVLLLVVVGLTVVGQVAAPYVYTLF